jgi:hypothetical protein
VRRKPSISEIFEKLPGMKAADCGVHIGVVGVPILWPAVSEESKKVVKLTVGEPNEALEVDRPARPPSTKTEVG